MWANIVCSLEERQGHRTGPGLQWGEPGSFSTEDTINFSAIWKHTSLECLLQNAAEINTPKQTQGLYLNQKECQGVKLDLLLCDKMSWGSKENKQTIKLGPASDALLLEMLTQNCPPPPDESTEGQENTCTSSHTPWAIIKKTDNNKCEWGYGETGTLIHSWWGSKKGWPLWKAVWQLFQSQTQSHCMAQQFHS